MSLAACQGMHTQNSRPFTYLSTESCQDLRFPFLSLYNHTVKAIAKYVDFVPQCSLCDQRRDCVLRLPPDIV